MSLNYCINTINALGLPPVKDPKQVSIYQSEDPKNPGISQAKQDQIIKTKISCITKAGHQRQPFVDLYDVIIAPDSERIEKLPQFKDKKVYRLGPDIVAIYTHQPTH